VPGADVVNNDQTVVTASLRGRLQALGYLQSGRPGEWRAGARPAGARRHGSRAGLGGDLWHPAILGESAILGPMARSAARV